MVGVVPFSQTQRIVIGWHALLFGQLIATVLFDDELARAMLAEQLYRAATTLRGHPYPR